MLMQTRINKSRSAGFTLIELMITVAIVGVLGTIAFTAYTSQTQRARRTDARTALVDMAGREEKLFSTTNAYSSSPAALGYGTGSFPITVGAGYYTVNVAVPDTAQASAAGTYAITATPVGVQSKDTACTTLAVNQLGVQSSTGTGTAASCWGTGT